MDHFIRVHGNKTNSTEKEKKFKKEEILVISTTLTVSYGSVGIKEPFGNEEAGPLNNSPCLSVSCLEAEEDLRLVL